MSDRLGVGLETFYLRLQLTAFAILFMKPVTIFGLRSVRLRSVRSVRLRSDLSDLSERLPSDLSEPPFFDLRSERERFPPACPEHGH